MIPHKPTESLRIRDFPLRKMLPSARLPGMSRCARHKRIDCERCAWLDRPTDPMVVATLIEPALQIGRGSAGRRKDTRSELSRKPRGRPISVNTRKAELARLRQQRYRARQLERQSGPPLEADFPERKIPG